MSECQFQNDPFAMAPVGLARLDLDGTYLQVNQQLCEMLGYDERQLQQLRLQDVVHPEDIETDRARIDALMQKGSGEYALSKRLMRRDGSSIVVHLSLRLVQNDEGKGDHFVIAVHNMSKTHKRLAQLEQRTRHDPLPRLRNRAGLIECLRNAYRTYRRQGTHFALAYLDLDGFKAINDTYGHVTGDKVLKAVAARLTEAVGPDGMVARVGGDEFAIVLNEIRHPDQMYGVGYRIQTAFAAPFETGGQHVAISVSIGFAHCPNDARSISVLLQHADRDMYARKYAPFPSQQRV